MDIVHATHQDKWDTFLSQQQFRPFLQSWTMGEVYRETGQEPIRLEIRDGNTLIGICQAIVVPARRGRHLAISYGPVLHPSHQNRDVLQELFAMLAKEAKKRHCSFIRVSPFTSIQHPLEFPHAKSSPLHMLAEHIWYIPLTEKDAWKQDDRTSQSSLRTEEDLLKNMRKNTRNLIRRAKRDGVTIERSSDPIKDLPYFVTLHEETRKRHNFTPYTNAFFTAQVQHFSKRGECTLYKAIYNNDVIACSIHMHMFGETSYHHGASTHKKEYAKIPASYLLQWTAIQDARNREDHVYSFWGISPDGVKNHPFAGVRTFKTGFGGELQELMHCQDVPTHSSYYLTRTFEQIRKWKRGF